MQRSDLVSRKERGGESAIPPPERRDGGAALDEFLTVQELANKLKLKRRQVYSLCEKDLIPYYRVGRAYRFRFHDVDAHLRGGAYVKKASSEG